nr:immunoglobulin light chain junction region [Macaca mulatta]MOV77669.1 immunoglobulin light chain junction region [Macaca mulatta]MOV77897.1 immunoglobulin light chain junction region [Macaca mulatta]MOV77923.1 immunoglobulin light chain junction region [Macaca mulatta]MOV78099.1 immunoglobulin light chain junction region [Macaca mulatta]
CQQHADSPRTF